MNILYVAWSDLGHGNQSRAEAMNRHTSHKARCWAQGEKYYTDLPRDMAGLREGVDWADLIHQTDTNPWQYKLDTHPHFVQEFRGGYLRMNGVNVWNWQIDHLKPIITTPELGRYTLRFHFIPMPIDTEKYRPEDRSDGWGDTTLPIRVLQTPTRRDYKDTDVLIEACNGLEGLELKLVEGRPREEAIRAKGEADIYFGDIKSGDYGSNEREAAAYGTSVIGRLMPICKCYEYENPIISVNTGAELRAKLREFIEDPEKVDHHKLAMRHWAETFLSYKVVAQRQEAFYTYVMEDDDNHKAWEDFSAIFRKTAREELKLTEFVDPPSLRW